MGNRVNEEQQAISYAKKLLKFRARSKGELRARLIEKGFSQTVVDKVVNDFEKTGVIDDEKFAYLFAYDMLVVHGYGPFRIRAKLHQFGIAEQITDRVIDRVLNQIDLVEVMKKVVQLHKVDREKSREFLYRRGFSSELVKLLDIEGGAEK
ncbi:MAG: regulatory protein RecX [Pseudothermotoga sp.]